MIRSGQTVAIVFLTRPTPGSVQAAPDETPEVILYKNGASLGTTVTVTNIATGLYKASCTLPTIAVGDILQLVSTAFFSSVEVHEIIWVDSKDVFAGAIPDVAAGGDGGIFISGTNNGTVNCTAGFQTTSFRTTLGAWLEHSDGPGIYVKSNGTGHPAVEIVANATNAHGIAITGSGTAAGIHLFGNPGLLIESPSGNALELEAGAGIAAFLKCASTLQAIKCVTTGGGVAKINALLEGIVATSFLNTGATVTPNTVQFTNGPSTTDALVGMMLLPMASGFVIKKSNARMCIAYDGDTQTATISGVWSDEATPVANNRPVAVMQSVDGDALADLLLDRSVAGEASGARTVGEALARLRNRNAVNGGVLNIYATNDTDVLWSATLTADGTLEPVSDMNPT